MMNSGPRHLPVLVEEVCLGLRLRPGGAWFDGTLGGGGHAESILERTAPDGRLLGVDVDPAAVRRASTRLDRFGDRMTLRRARFDTLGRLAIEFGFSPFDGILLDLGYSSDQMDDPARGFSFQTDGALDMRLDPDGDTTAADLVNTLPVDDLADVIWRFGDERRSRRIARAIQRARPIRTTAELAQIVARAAGPVAKRYSIHPATRTFQALRIAVNEELDVLERTLPIAIDHLAPGGRLAIISFHSLEDRIVKRAFLKESGQLPEDAPPMATAPPARIERITRKPIRPGPEEIEANPRARSARLRVAERLAPAEAAA